MQVKAVLQERHSGIHQQACQFAEKYFERILGRKWRNWQTSRNSARGLQDGSAGGKTEKVGFFKIWPRRDEILKKIPRMADSRLQSFLKD